MRVETLSVRVLSIRLVMGKTFGFARIADRGGEAFISPPLMREVEGNAPLHAIVEMAEKGRRVVRFLDKPEVRYIWEESDDKARLVALIPELVCIKADFQESHAGEPCWVSDYNHIELSQLWNAGVQAGQSELLSRWEKEFFMPAYGEEIIRRSPRLFAEWEKSLPAMAEKKMASVQHSVKTGYSVSVEDIEEALRPWWEEYAPAEMRAKIEVLRQEHLTPIRTFILGVVEEKRVARERWMAGRLAEATKALSEVGVDDLTPAEVERHQGGRGIRMAEAVQELRQLRVESAVKKWAEARGLTAGCNITQQGGWVSHEDSGVGMHGGDYSEWQEWVWEPWARRALTLAGLDVCSVVSACEAGRADQFARDAVRAEILAAEKRGEVRRWRLTSFDFEGSRCGLNACWGKREVLLDEARGNEAFDGDRWEVSDRLMAEWPSVAKTLRRVSEARAKASELRKVRELRERGLREEEARQAAKSAEEERRLISIVSVRKGWRTMLS